MTAVDNVEINTFSFTHAGKIRADNQDSVLLCRNDDEINYIVGHLYGIADGMGGYAHGGIASSIALETFFETFYEAEGASPLQKFKVGIQNANLSVYQKAQQLGSGRMGTTLTTVNIVGHNMYVGHVGDSRAYLIRNNNISCLTNDHTRVGELVRMKILSPDKVRTHNQRSVLDKCLGVSLFVQPDIFKVSVSENDIILLCTDGVWSVIEDSEFAQLSQDIKDPEKFALKIFDLAMERDSDDNLSIVAIYLKRLGKVTDNSDSRKISFIPNFLRKLIK